jgi:predicted RNA methylase
LAIDPENELKQIIDQFGDWTAYDIKLTETLYTGKHRRPFYQLRRITQTILDLFKNNINHLRILDLGSLEGQYSIELGLHGAKVVGIEGREQNIERARFAKKVLNLRNVEFYLDDVRNLSKEKYGKFDVVLCSGILYHLDFPDNMEFIEKIYDVCDYCTIIDTHIGSNPTAKKIFKDHEYEGDVYREHDPSASTENRLKQAWASLDNDNSFWLTKKSLYDFLMRVGFTTITEMYSHNASAKIQGDRITLIAFKGDPIILETSPITNGLAEPLDHLSEQEKLVQKLIKENQLLTSTIAQIVNALVQMQDLKNKL